MFKTVLLRYNWHTIDCTCLKGTVSRHYTCRYNSFIKYMIYKCFLPFMLSFPFLNCIFQREHILIFKNSNVSVFLLWIALLVLHQRNFCLSRGHKDFSPILLIFLFMINWVNFGMRYEVYIEVDFFVYGHPMFPARFFEKTVLSLLNCLCNFVEN